LRQGVSFRRCGRSRALYPSRASKLIDVRLASCLVIAVIRALPESMVMRTKF